MTSDTVRRRIAIAAIALVLMAVCDICEAKVPRERYDEITAKNPFGAPPENFDPTKDPASVSAKDTAKEETKLTKEQEKLQRSVKFCAINIDPAGRVMVGFIDNENPKFPANYYLPVGGKKNGWEVISADPAAKTMQICKDGVNLEFSLGSSSPTVSANAKEDKSATSAEDAEMDIAPMPLLYSAKPNENKRGSGLLSPRQMRRKKKETLNEMNKTLEAVTTRMEQMDEDKRRREEEIAKERENMRADLQAVAESLKAEREAKKAMQESAADTVEAPAEYAQ